MSLSYGWGVRLRPRLVSLAPLAFLNAGPNSPTIGMDTGNESLCFFEFLVIVRTPQLFLILTHWSKRQLDDGVCHRGYFGVNEAWVNDASRILIISEKKKFPHFSRVIAVWYSQIVLNRCVFTDFWIWCSITLFFKKYISSLCIVLLLHWNPFRCWVRF